MFVPQHTAFCIYFIHPWTTHPRTTHPRTTKPQKINPWTTTPLNLDNISSMHNLYATHKQETCTCSMTFFIDLQTSKLREEIYEKDNFKATQRVYYNQQTSNPREEKL